MVWQDSTDSHRLHDEGVQSTFLWGKTDNGQLNGSLVKLPPGFQGKLLTSATEFRAIVIQGQMAYQSAIIDDEKVLDAGSYSGSEGAFSHELSVPDNSEVTLYIRTNDNYEIN